MNTPRRHVRICCWIVLSLGLAAAARAQTAPTITAHPTSRGVPVGASVLFSVSFSGTPTPTLQWRKDGVVIPGATNAILTLASTTVASAGNYTVVVTNTAGSVTSRPATLTIAPIITDQPDGDGVTAGSSITFNVTATGATTYQWRKDNTPIPGASGSTLALTNVQTPADYDVVVTNSAGTAISEKASLSVFAGAPGGTSVTVAAGDAISFNATATAGATFQWRRNGNPIAGATSATHTIARFGFNDAGSYTVVITTGGTSVTSTATTVTLRPPSVVKQPPEFNPPTGVTAGSSVTFNVVASGAPSYQWRRNNTAIPGATGANLTVVNVQETATYDVVLTSPSGSVNSQPANLSVNPPTQPPTSANAIVNAGDSISFNATATTAGAAFQWRRNNVALSGATTATFNIPSVTPADAGDYAVVMTTAGVAVTSVVTTLVVNVPDGYPAISTQPTSQVATAGSTVGFVVAATGAAPLAYQWRKDGADLPGATNANLALSNVAVANAGSYVVVVSNALGALPSDPVTLAVNPAPIVQGSLINLSILTSITTADPFFILGTVIGGAGTSGNKALLVRAAGPSLVPLNVAGVLPNPRFDLFRVNALVGSNDDWGGSAALVAVFNQVGAFPYVAPTSLDAALSNTSLTPGDYTVQVSGTGGATGMVIAELYDATPSGAFTAATPRLVNVSVRKQIDPGTLLTAGFVIRGGPRTVLIRAVGPTLGGPPFGVPGAMADPRIQLFNASAAVIGGNDNWGGGAELAAAFTRVGAFALPGGSQDAALLATQLSEGNYTAQVSGVGGTGGVVVVEVYEVPLP